MPILPDVRCLKGSSLLGLALVACGAIVGGCAPPGGPDAVIVSPGSGKIQRTAQGIPIVRVRVLENQTAVRLSAGASPTYQIERSGSGSLEIGGRAGGVSISMLGQGGWNLGGVAVQRAGTLSFHETAPGSLAINNVTYRGGFRFVPVGAGRFDVINDVDIDDYLKSVISKELLNPWHAEAFRAQAIVARTYALHEVATVGAGRYWDVFDDERSQVYGGLGAETAKSREAVDATRGIVVAYGPPGNEKIFKAYFSACCGGIGQNPQDAFGDGLLAPLAEKNVGGLCSASPRYNWGPIMMSKGEVTRRLKLWGAKHSRPEASVGPVAHIAPAQENRFGRPVRFLLTDAHGYRYSLTAEELRNALNADSRVVFSSFLIVRENGGNFIISGHGSGHGVGMCQYCAEALAARGESHEQIVRFSYPGAVLIRAY